MAAELCCRHALGKILRNLLSLPANNCTATFVKAALLKTFEDLERELFVAGITERCGASLALVIGDWLFTAVLGPCSAVLCQADGSAPPASGSHGYAATQLSAPGAMSVPTSPEHTLGTPDVRGTQMSLGDGHEPFFVLAGVPVTSAVPSKEITDICAGFLRRPRASCGEIVARAAKKLGDTAECATVAGFLKAAEKVTKEGEPASKRAKKEAQQLSMESVRLRHIIVRYKDAKQAFDPLKNKAVTRTREEAEALLRETLTELLKDGDHTGDSMWAAKVLPAKRSRLGSLMRAARIRNASRPSRAAQVVVTLGG